MIHFWMLWCAGAKQILKKNWVKYWLGLLRLQKLGLALFIVFNSYLAQPCLVILDWEPGDDAHAATLERASPTAGLKCTAYFGIQDNGITAVLLLYNSCFKILATIGITYIYNKQMTLYILHFKIMILVFTNAFKEPNMRTYYSKSYFYFIIFFKPNLKNFMYDGSKGRARSWWRWISPELSPSLSHTREQVQEIVIQLHPSGWI